MSSSTAGSQQQQQSKPTPEQVQEAAHAVGYSLGTQAYAIVGGAACTLLGSLRETEDVDVVVPQGATIETRQKLRSQPDYFDIDRRTLHTLYKSEPPVEIELLAPPSLFKEEFSASTPVVLVAGVKVLKPALILNAKCHSILGRATKEKKTTDSFDIKFFLEWCAKNNNLPTAAEVPRATKEFVEWFISEYEGRELWENAGYNFETGK